MSRAVMQQALEALEGGEDGGYRAKVAIAAIKAALAQPDHIAGGGKKVEQEPVAWISKHGVVYPLDAKDEVHPINELQPLYPSPPKRQPLTDAAITKAFNKAMAKRPKDSSNAETNRLFARAIEAAHGIGGEQ